MPRGLQNEIYPKQNFFKVLPLKISNTFQTRFYQKNDANSFQS